MKWIKVKDKKPKFLQEVFLIWPGVGEFRVRVARLPISEMDNDHYWMFKLVNGETRFTKIFEDDVYAEVDE